MKQKTKIESVKEMSEKYFTLSSVARLKILKICSTTPTTIKQLIKMLDMSSSTISEHIRILYLSGFIEKIRNRDNSIIIKTLVEIDESGKVII